MHADITLVDGSWSAKGARFDTLEAALGTPVIASPILPEYTAQWISASVVGGVAQVTPEVLAALVDDVRTRKVKRPVDGGSEDSEPHATARRSDALANGWIHDARLVLTGDGPEMQVLAELIPSIAANRKSGRLAYASIHASVTKDGPGSQFHGLALTNMPLDPNVHASTIQRAHPPTPTPPREAIERARPAEDKMTPDKPKDPPAEVKAAMTPEEMGAKLEEMAAMVAAQAEEIAALKAALTGTTEELAASRAAQVDETPEKLTDKAISEGRIPRDQRPVYVELARKSRDSFDRIIAARAPLTGRIVSPSQSVELSQRPSAMAATPAEQAKAQILAIPGMSAEQKQAIINNIVEG